MPVCVDVTLEVILSKAGLPIPVSSVTTIVTIGSWPSTVSNGSSVGIADVTTRFTNAIVEFVGVPDIVKCQLTLPVFTDVISSRIRHVSSYKSWILTVKT